MKKPRSLCLSFLFLGIAACGQTQGSREEAERQRMMAEQAKMEALAERERAKSEAQKAEALQHFLMAMLASADPVNEGGRVDAMQVLDRASEEMERAFPGHPETEASLRDVLGMNYRQLGMRIAAREQFAAALEIRRRVFGEKHPMTLSSMLRLAEVESAFESEALLTQVKEGRKEVLGLEHPDTLAAMHRQAELRFNRGDFAGAESLCRDVLENRRRVLGDAHPQTRESARLMVALCEALGKKEKADEYRAMIDSD